MPKYTVVNPIKHGGQRHMPGVEVEMDAKTAKPLLASGDLAEEKAQPPALLGSTVLPEKVQLNSNKKVPVANVVNLAFKNSGLTVDEWNALAEADREAKLAEAVEQMKAGK